VPIDSESITDITTDPLAEPHTKLSDKIEVTLGKFHDGHLAFTGTSIIDLLKRVAPYKQSSIQKITELKYTIEP
jgi:hypothetical protein